ncbi:hypothetical protein [Paenibacillus chitinolyticus]
MGREPVKGVKLDLKVPVSVSVKPVEEIRRWAEARNIAFTRKSFVRWI